jgi:hypothetical protein
MVPVRSNWLGWVYWLLQAGLSLLHGKTPQLSPAHLAALVIGGIVALVALFCLAFVVMQIRSRLRSSLMYDMRLVDEKTARPAYRVRLRLFVFSADAGTVQAHHTRPSEVLLQRFSGQPFTRSSLIDAYRGRRETAHQNKQRGQEQSNVLDHLVAAHASHWLGI